MRAFVVALALVLPAALPVRAARAETATANDDAFRARLQQNIGIAGRARTTLDAQARRRAPKGLSAEQKRSYDEQTKWLAETSARFAALEARMKTAAAKRGNASELASLNMEFGSARDAATTGSQRFDAAGPACHERHAATASALKG